MIIDFEGQDIRKGEPISWGIIRSPNDVKTELETVLTLLVHMVQNRMGITREEAMRFIVKSLALELNGDTKEPAENMSIWAELWQYAKDALNLRK